MFSKVLTYLPGVGYVGYAIYQAVNLHDPGSALGSLAAAAGIFGFSNVLHSVKASLSK